MPRHLSSRSGCAFGGEAFQCFSVSVDNGRLIWGKIFFIYIYIIYNIYINNYYSIFPMLQFQLKH